MERKFNLDKEKYATKNQNLSLCWKKENIVKEMSTHILHLELEDTKRYTNMLVTYLNGVHQTD